MEEKRKGINDRKEMRNKIIEIKSLLFVWKWGEKGKRKENNTFVFPLFGLQ